MNKWTLEEIKLLKNYYPQSGTLIYRLFPQRTPRQVALKANELKVSVNPVTKKFINGRSLFKHNENELIDQFLDITSPNVAYLLGLLWADGYNCRSLVSHSFGTISLTASDFKSDWKDIDQVISPILPWKRIIEIKGLHRPQMRWSIVSKRLSNLLEQWGLRTGRRNFGNLLERIPSNLFPAFLRGLVDGDGCWNINNKPRLHITAAYDFNWEHLITRIQNEIDVDLKVYRNATKIGGTSTLSCTNHESIRLGDYIYEDFSDIGLSRKYLSYREFKSL